MKLEIFEILIQNYLKFLPRFPGVVRGEELGKMLPCLFFPVLRFLLYTALHSSLRITLIQDDSYSGVTGERDGEVVCMYVFMGMYTILVG